MAPLPKKKSTRGRSNMRKGTFRRTIGALAKCPNCGKLKQPHKACPSCGFYR